MIIGNCDYTFLVISAILALLLGIISLANSFLLAYNTYRSGVKGWKRIIERNGGKIYISSREERYTKAFVVEIHSEV